MLRSLKSSELAVDYERVLAGSIDDANLAIDLDKIIAAVRRQAILIAAIGAVALMMGLAYLATATPIYTASSYILIDPRNSTGAILYNELADLSLDSSGVDSQVEVLKSENIIIDVVKSLSLAGNTDGTESPSLLSKIKMAIGGVFASDVDPGPDVDLIRDAVETVARNLDIRRVGRTYVLRISYSSPDPDLSARIANTVAEAYLDDQLGAKYQAASRAVEWLEARIMELKKKSIESDLAVQKFKSEHGLISANGRLVNEQQLVEINSELIMARAETARAEARYLGIKGIIAQGDPEGAVPESLNSTVINSLREKYFAASKREEDIRKQLGDDHQAAIRARQEKEQYESLIFEELGRIGQSYESEYKVALAKERALKSNLSGLVGVAESDNQAQVQLRELEREADSYRTMYEASLQRFQEAVEQQSVPVTEARVITAAVAPKSPSAPKKSLVLALSLMVGVLGGAAIGAIREFSDRSFRTAEHADELGLQSLGMLPAVQPNAGIPAVTPAHSMAADHSSRPTNYQPLMRYVIDSPLSVFSKALRGVKVSIDQQLQERKTKVIGVISAGPGEGKSTISKNLSTAMSRLGCKTLLIDGDFNTGALSRAIVPGAHVGLIQALETSRPLQESCLPETESGLLFLPIATNNLDSETMLTQGLLDNVLRKANGAFEYIVIDLPSIECAVDTHAVAPLVDAFVIVVEWGKTDRRKVEKLLRSNDCLRDKCLGILVNKVDQKTVGLYSDSAVAFQFPALDTVDFWKGLSSRMRFTVPRRFAKASNSSDTEPIAQSSATLPSSAPDRGELGWLSDYVRSRQDAGGESDHWQS